MNRDDRLTLFEKSVPGRRCGALPTTGLAEEKPLESLLGKGNVRTTAAELPEVGEHDLVRHFNNLSKMNMSVDSNFYPLGSCTMKYNPRINETVAATPAFALAHPYQPHEQLQGLLALLYELKEILAEVSGLPGVTLQPAAGAHGELCGMMLIKARVDDKGETGRYKILIPDSAHGTNPATCTTAGLTPVEVKSGADGRIHLDAVKAALGDDVAGMMITNPNTLGLFETEIGELAKLLHDAGAYLYMDGANMNALCGVARPGDFGVDVMHFNVHKTFSTPHGGGGPGAGPVACTAELEPYLPAPRLVKDGDTYLLQHTGFPKSIGRIKQYLGNVGILVRAWAYLRALGPDGLREMTQNAVLNANYLRILLRDTYHLGHDEICMHECVFDDSLQEKATGVTTKDIGKRLLDYGFHAPTTYFPLIVHGALMIEPTETESRQTLESFAAAMKAIAKESLDSPDTVKTAPHRCPVKRVDDVKATKEPRLIV